MTGKEYLSSLANVTYDKDKIDVIESLYTKDLTEIILKMISNADEPIFLDDDSRILSYSEIVDAEKDLHVKFKEKGIIPLVDCGDNDFIVYQFNNRKFSKFNIVDETIFKEKQSIEEILK